jgi:hypothetical protein
MTRAILAAAGLAALAWGAWLTWDFATASARDGIQALAFFLGATVVHDALVAPLVGLTGLLIARRLPPPWRTPVAAGGALSAVLVLLAVPLLWHPFGVPTNPGLHDDDYAVHLLISLAAVWLVVVVAGTVTSRSRARAARAVDHADPRRCG